MNTQTGVSSVSTLSSGDGVRVSAVIWLMIVYLWFFVTTPDRRFPVFADIHFERILVALVVLALFAGQAIPRQVSRTTVYLALFFLWCLLSYSLSDYRGVPPSVWWIENYWKLMLFYFMLLHSIRSFKDLFTLVAGLCVVSFFYQLHSWNDFLQGGSYVWQQGLRRIVGVWSGGGIGAANGFGLLGLFSLPFGIFWLMVTKRRAVKIGVIAFLGICFATIAFSGTRAAIVSAALVLLLTFRWSILRPRVLVLGAVAIGVGLTVLPPDLKHRYLDLIYVSEDAAPTDELADRIAEQSAQSRIQGLVDGWELFMRKPIIGYGPGSSAFARREVNTTDVWVNAEDEYLELHNLYGQVLSETGLVGAALFMALLFSALLQLRALRREMSADQSAEADMYRAMIELLQTSLLVMLFYGMFAHTLYRYYWLLLFALHAALMQLARNRRQAAAVSTPVALSVRT